MVKIITFECRGNNKLPGVIHILLSYYSDVKRKKLIFFKFFLSFRFSISNSYFEWQK